MQMKKSEHLRAAFCVRFSNEKYNIARTKSYLTSYQHISTILGLLEIRPDSLSSLGSEGNARVLTKLESEESSRTFGVLGATESGPILLAPKQAE